MSEEEDDDLELLRSAALASIKKKSSDDDELHETDDLETLRKMALTSRKQHNENEKRTMKKIQTTESSNLISLTPVTNSSGKSDSEQEESPSKSSSDESEEEKSSAESDDDSSTSEQKSIKQNSTASEKNEVKNEEEDLLNAIDHFLDEGVMMLEQVTEISPPKETKKKVVKNTKSKKKEEPKTVKKPKNSKLADKTKSKTKTEKKVPIPKSVPPKQSTEKPKTTRRTTKPSHADEEETKQSVQVAWNSADLPLNEKPKEASDSDSVHSSDLSFLSSCDEEADRKVIEASVSAKPERQFIRIKRQKLDEIKKENRTRRFSGENAYEGETRDEEPPPRPTRSDRKLPDLRDKLKRRRKKGDGKGEKRNHAYLQQSENGSANVPQRIYVKPSVVYENSSISKTYAKSKDELTRTITNRYIVTSRNVRDENYSPLQVRLTDGDEKRNIKSFRRKRSVVQYKPDESMTEKQQRVENIKKAQEARVLETESFSDLSGDFDDFEIEEPTEPSTPEEDDTSNKKVSSVKKPAQKVRVSSSQPLKKQESKKAMKKKQESDEDSPLSDYDEEADEEQGEIKGSPVRSSSSSSSQDSDVEVFPVRSKVKMFKNNSREEKRSKRRVNVQISEPLIRRERASPPPQRRAQVNSRLGVRRERNRREMETTIERPRAYDDDRDSHKRRNRKIEVENDKVKPKKPVKHRIGHNESELRPRSRRRSDDRDFPRKTADREKDVDARIRRINEQNARIMKRRQQIEMEEKKFRLKPG